MTVSRRVLSRTLSLILSRAGLNLFIWVVMLQDMTSDLVGKCTLAPRDVVHSMLKWLAQGYSSCKCDGVRNDQRTWLINSRILYKSVVVAWCY